MTAMRNVVLCCALVLAGAGAVPLQRRQFDVAVVGSTPGGIAAAVAANGSAP